MSTPPLAGDYNQPEDDGSWNRPKSSINDPGRDNDADDYTYDPDSEPQQQQIGGWFGDERDETEWSKSRRGETAWGSPMYRDHLDNRPDDPYGAGKGSYSEKSNVPGHDGFVSAVGKYRKAQSKYRDIRHPSRVVRRKLGRIFDKW